MISNKRRREIVRHFGERLQTLDDCRQSFERSLEEDREGVVESVNSGRVPANDTNVKEAIVTIDKQILAFRYMMIVAVCTYMEEFMRSLGASLIPDFDSKANKSKPGSWLIRQLEVYEAETKMNMAPIRAHIENFERVIKVRNSIVHAWGRVDACKYRSQIQHILSDGELDELSQDGDIHLNEEAYVKATDAAIEIVEHLLNVSNSQSSGDAQASGSTQTNPKDS